MPDVFIFLAVSLTVWVAGTTLLRVVHLSPDDATERSLAALVAGFALLGLLILGLGLLGLLIWWVVATLLVLALLCSVRNIGDCLRDLGLFATSLRWELIRSPLRMAHLAIVLIIVIQLVAALAPPIPADFDGLSQHLAHAKQYAHDGEIRPLWYDHHAHFPATLQMMYTVAHLFGVPGASKLFHWGFGIIAIGAVVMMGRRLLAPAAGSYGGLVLATTPGVAWLMGVGYVDLATMACGVLALHFFIRWTQEDDQNWLLWLSAVMAGAGAATKMQGLALLGLLVVATIIVLRPRFARGLGHAAAYVGIALIVCGPWYLKSYLWTGNPVYPFAYEVFGGKMWSADRAEGYTYDQRNYGKGELPPRSEWAEMPPLERFFSGPREPLHLLLAPVNLTIEAPEFTVPAGDVWVWLSDSVSPLWLAFLPLLAFYRRPPPVKIMLWILLPLWLWWLGSMQLTRYLLPTLALVAPAIGWAVVEAERHSDLLATIVKAVMKVWTVVAVSMMLIYVAPQAPAALGLTTTEEYLAEHSLYRASVFINNSTPPDAKVALYGEPRGYYLNRDYIWAERGHSALIDYDSVERPRDLVSEWWRLGITHVMINQAYFPDIERSPDPLASLIRGAMEEGLLGPMGAPATARPYLLLQVAPERPEQESVPPEQELPTPPFAL